MLTQKNGGYLIAKKFYFGESPEKGTVFLSKTKGEIMNYKTDKIENVDFPGEYDVQGSTIRCMEAGELLHFEIHNGENHIALLQSTAVLEKETIEDIDTWIVVSKDIEDEISRLELEGEVIVMGEETNSTTDSEAE